MPTTKVTNKPVETTSRLVGNTKQQQQQVKMKTGVHTESLRKVQTTPCKPRASSCSRCVHSISRCDDGSIRMKKTSTARIEGGGRSRSTCVTAPKPAGSRVKTTSTTTPAVQKGTCSVKHAAGTTAKSVELSTEDQRHKKAIQCHKAFTVIAPNPMKRREIQKKAEEELAALEELRLSKAMAYVSINPSSVGGCMSLQEVRLKQQQEMQASRRQRHIKKLLVEPTTSVVMS